MAKRTMEEVQKELIAAHEAGEQEKVKTLLEEKKELILDVLREGPLTYVHFTEKEPSEE